MKKRAVLGSSFLLALSAFLAACGNMNTVIAKDGSYRMDAFVGGRNLYDGATIGAADSIRPSFSSEVEGDPDVTGLRMLLETVDGKVVSSGVTYRLSSDGAVRDIDEQPILVPRFSGDLPTFTFPADFSVGRYVLVMRALGEDGVLFEQRRSIYYLADAVFSLGKVLSYPPGTGPSATGLLFPTEIYLMLRAEIEADERLDPYVAWYVGTKLIGVGRLADGGNQILWKAPSREGFHTIRVEVYPEAPRDPKSPDLIGASAELTVATSNTAAAPGLPGKSTDYARLYRFLGELTDAADAGRAFVRTDGAVPLWVPVSDSYGLSIGANEQYRLELPLAPVRAGGVDPARIVTRVAVSAIGPIWRASFIGIADLEALSAELSSVEGGLQILLADGEQEASSVVEMPASVAADEAVLVEVTLTASSPEATALVSVNGSVPNAVSIPFSAVLMGTGSVSLGGTASSASDETTEVTVAQRTAVIDELAVTVDPPAEKEIELSTLEN